MPACYPSPVTCAFENSINKPLQLDITARLPLYYIMSVLTIQSRVSRGYVGNSAAVPSMQKFGLNAIAVDTSLLSNHPGHGRFTGGPIPTSAIYTIICGVKELFEYDPIDMILTGYLGTLPTAKLVLNFIKELKEEYSNIPYCLDPVMGDNGKLYVDHNLVSFFRDHALPLADIALPNAFEAKILLGEYPSKIENTPEIAIQLAKKGPSRVAVTGVKTNDGLAIYVAEGSNLWVIDTKRIDVAASGAGDTFAAIVLAHLIKTKISFPEAVARAASSIHDILCLTQKLGNRDIALVEGLELLRSPQTHYMPRKIFST